jgi:hypothetical protein
MNLPPGRIALVVVLSPRMVYSMTEWPRMRAAAVSEGFGVVAWRSPALPEREWQDAVAKVRWSASDIARVSATPTACSSWLGQPNHFPYSVVIERGRVHPSPIWGVLPNPAWIESLQLRRRHLALTGAGVGQ